MESIITLQNPEEALATFGSQDRNLRLIRDAFGVQVIARDSMIKLIGEDDEVARATAVIERLVEVVRERGTLTASEVGSAISASAGLQESTQANEPDSAVKISSSANPTKVVKPSDTTITIFSKKQYIRPKTRGQAEYVEAIQQSDIVFCTGPAGTGKTYLAVAMAVSALKKGEVEKIVLARPAVEAGERLGFLPGDLQAKVNPYLRPLYDALYDMTEANQIKKLIENDIIEVIPLAYMRGRTLDDASIILDEAQNCTVKQMKMFLTRLGVNSKVVVTGDITQIDLPEEEVSGLVNAQAILAGVQGIGFVQLTEEDIVRHRLVRNIVSAYELSAPGG